MAVEKPVFEHLAIDPELERKAHLLRESTLFVNPSDDAELAEKQMIFLALAGLKPVAGGASGHWTADEQGRHTVADDAQEVAAFLDSLGLAYRLSRDEHCTMAIVSLRPELLDQYVNAPDSITAGRLLGFPETAVQAFARDDCLPIEEQEVVEQTNGLPWNNVPFRFSREHWREELAVAQKWYDALKEYGLA